MGDSSLRSLLALVATSRYLPALQARITCRWPAALPAAGPVGRQPQV